MFNKKPLISRGWVRYLAYSQVLRSGGRREGARSVVMQRSAFSWFVPSAGAETGQNAFLSRSTYDKLTLGTSVTDPVAFSAACDFAMRYTAEPSGRGRREVGRLTRFGNTS